MAKQQYDNTNTGLIFKKTPKTPEYPILSGYLDVEGVQYYISVWPLLDREGRRRLNKADEPMFSVKLTRRVDDDDEVPI